MTEDEAKTKWCPMVRHSGDGNQFNRGVINPINDHLHNQGILCNCVASACMMWQWTGRSEAGKLITGHCGLAGKP